MILRLRQARVEKHMKQQDVAEAIGVTRVTYARYEAGDREPDYDTLIKLTKLFDVTVDYLLGLTDIPNIYVTTGVGRLDATTYTTEKSLSLQEQKQAEKTIDYALNDG